jgi:zinc-binding alcohol dehydrogenase family protein
MKAIGFRRQGGPEVLETVEVPEPAVRARDLLVRVVAAGVNPVDAKVRAGTRPGPPLEDVVVPGWDAAGVVVGTGPEVRGFRVGDEVWFAGDRHRQGSYAERVAVDERIVSRKPAALSFEDAAAIPLTAITAWEALFEELLLQEDAGPSRTLLVLGGGGGVGSIAVQLAKRVARVGVVATASRPESAAWCRAMGADLVIDHRDRLAPQMPASGEVGADWVLACAEPFDVLAVAEVTKPLGRVCSILPVRGADLTPFFGKRVALCHEPMFARTMYDVEPERQGAILGRVATLFDRGELRSTRTRTLSWKDARLAHEAIGTGHTVGKLVLRVADGSSSPGARAPMGRT